MKSNKRTTYLGFALLAVAVLIVGGFQSTQAASTKADIYIYHDPNASGSEKSRFEEAKTLMDSKGVTYEVKRSTHSRVAKLAGLKRTVMPRFFLGDPNQRGFLPKSKSNNGGLRWLKGIVDTIQDRINNLSAEPKAIDCVNDNCWALDLSWDPGAYSNFRVTWELYARDPSNKQSADIQSTDGSYTISPLPEATIYKITVQGIVNGTPMGPVVTVYAPTGPAL